MGLNGLKVLSAQEGGPKSKTLKGKVGRPRTSEEETGFIKAEDIVYEWLEERLPLLREYREKNGISATSLY